jgi:hypothetical protein
MMHDIRFQSTVKQSQLEHGEKLTERLPATPHKRNGHERKAFVGDPLSMIPNARHNMDIHAGIPCGPGQIQPVCPEIGILRDQQKQTRSLDKHGSFRDFVITTA